MSNSTPLLPQMSSSQASKEVTFNAAIAASSPAALYARNDLTSTGLTWGYFGGQFNTIAVANGTIGLTASNTNYVVAHRTTGVVTVATNTTNWLNTATYLQLYSIVAGASTVTSYIDFRQALGGVGGGGSGTPGGSTTQVQYNASGAFAGDSKFTYDATNNVLTVGTVATKIDSGTNPLDTHTLSLPAGALLAIATGSTGAIKIALPVALYSLDFAVKLRVELFDSNDNKTCTVQIGASYVGSTHIWSTAESIQIIGTDATVDYAIRVGSDGTAPCLWIAELASTWGVLRAYVSDAMFTGFAADQVVGIAASGWAMSIATSFGTVNAIVADNLAWPSATGVRAGTSLTTQAADNIAAPVSVTAATPLNVVSMTVAVAGTYLVTGAVTFIGAATTNITSVASTIATASAALTMSSPDTMEVRVQFTVAASGTTFATPSRVLNLTAGQVIYLVGRANFTISTMTAIGIINAVRLGP